MAQELPTQPTSSNLFAAQVVSNSTFANGPELSPDAKETNDAHQLPSKGAHTPQASQMRGFQVGEVPLHSSSNRE